MHVEKLIASGTSADEGAEEDGLSVPGHFASVEGTQGHQDAAERQESGTVAELEREHIENRQR